MKNINVKIILSASFLLFLLWLAPAFAGTVTPEEKGLGIAREYDRRNSGFLNYEVSLKMHLVTRSGKTRIQRG